MRYIVIACLVALIPATAALAFDLPASTDAAAMVNGTIISAAEYRFELARALRQRKKIEKELEPVSLSMIKKDVLETLIGRELLYQESRRKGIQVREAAVEEEMSKLRRQIPGGDSFSTSLGKMELSEQDFKALIERGMTIQALIDSEFGAKTTVTENDEKSYYDSHPDNFLQPAQVRLSHILIKFGTNVESGKIEARTKIEAIQRKISRGDDFAALAKESDDSKNSRKGGDLGFYSPGQLGKEIEKATFSLGVGQVSSIVEDRFGFHLLKVTERRPEAVLPFENVRDRINKQLKRERTLSLVNPYLKRIREAAKVEILLDGSGE